MGPAATVSEQQSPLSGLEPWEQRDWLPDGDDLPDSLKKLRAQHLAAVENFENDVRANVQLKVEVDAAARRGDARYATRSHPGPSSPSATTPTAIRPGLKWRRKMCSPAATSLPWHRWPCSTSFAKPTSAPN